MGEDMKESVFFVAFLLTMTAFLSAQDDRGETRELIFPVVTSGAIGGEELGRQFRTHVIARNLTVFQGATTTVEASVELFSGSGELLLETVKEISYEDQYNPGGIVFQFELPEDHGFLEGWARLSAPQEAPVSGEADVILSDRSNSPLSGAIVEAVVPAEDFRTSYINEPGVRSAYSFVNPSPTETLLVVAWFWGACIVYPIDTLEIPPLQRMSVFVDGTMVGSDCPRETGELQPRQASFKGSHPFALGALKVYQSHNQIHFSALPVYPVHHGGLFPKIP